MKDEEIIRQFNLNANEHQTIMDKLEKFGDKLILMAGNIANPETYREYARAGVDYVRISVGSGSCCITSSNSGCYTPMASLIVKCSEIKNKCTSKTSFTR